MGPDEVRIQVRRTFSEFDQGHAELPPQRKSAWRCRQSTYASDVNARDLDLLVARRVRVGHQLRVLARQSPWAAAF
jgi:hypothetical protein